MLGAELKSANIVFWMPNAPCITKDGVNSVSDENEVAAIENQNGNHWRKILTIAAKLSVDVEEEWRHYKANRLLIESTFVFSKADFEGSKAKFKFIVGKQLAESKPPPLDADKIYGVNDPLERSNDRVVLSKEGVYWTPYFDYRQFPNALIGAVRAYMQD
ncbi:DUF6942 family protein [Marinomonas balearica]|uniref:Uncharacterized protein n=1 Tax=Marinomonas balearica TaxID=491947 RepID=A0A4R6M7P7_9GAMM|nr:hypothetical protein [Marinomonas balearica]TDO96925.1 hypothetical protein DFP79_2696 [Marinomonas balearica]